MRLYLATGFPGGGSAALVCAPSLRAAKARLWRHMADQSVPTNVDQRRRVAWQEVDVCGKPGVVIMGEVSVA